MPHPVIDHLSRHRVAVAGVVIAGGLAVATFALGGRPAPPERVTGPELAIAIVPPVEPDVQPGDVMDVGLLNDGFDRASLRRTPPPPPLDAPYDGPPSRIELAMAPPEPPAPRRMASAPRRERDFDRDYDRPAPPPPPRADYEGDPRAFGFDARRPDYEAERAERRAMMEARLEARIRDRLEAERREADWRARERAERERYDRGPPPPPWVRRQESRPYGY